MNTYAKLLEMDDRVRAGETTLKDVLDELRQLKVIVSSLNPAQVDAALARPEPEPVVEGDEPVDEPEPESHTPEPIKRKRR